MGDEQGSACTPDQNANMLQNERKAFAPVVIEAFDTNIAFRAVCSTRRPKNVTGPAPFQRYAHTIHIYSALSLGTCCNLCLIHSTVTGYDSRVCRGCHRQKKHSGTKQQSSRKKRWNGECGTHEHPECDACACCEGCGKNGYPNIRAHHDSAVAAKDMAAGPRLPHL